MALQWRRCDMFVSSPVSLCAANLRALLQEQSSRTDGSRMVTLVPPTNHLCDCKHVPITSEKSTRGARVAPQRRTNQQLH